MTFYFPLSHLCFSYMTNHSFFLTSAILFCSSSFSPSLIFLSSHPSPSPTFMQSLFLFHPFLSLSCSSQLFNHTWLMPKKEREREGTNGRRDRESKERVGDRDREREKMRAAGLSVRHMVSEWEIFASSQRELLVPLSPLSVVGLLLRKDLVWILLLLLHFFSFSSLSPLLPSPLCLTEGLQLSIFPKVSPLVLLSPHPPSPPLSPASPLRMSCEEAQLHKERLQALAVSQSVFKLSLFCSVCLFSFFLSLAFCVFALPSCLSVSDLKHEGFHGRQTSCLTLT